jgi:putative nucleotidyltransferase with HDIG domain
MIKILFVDDEPYVLEGMRRMLRSMRNEWTMSFALGGAEAFELLDREPFDVIVTDMKMPGIGGAELLQSVMEKYPQIIRIILSGFSEKEMSMKSVGTTHQYLSKPCDPEVLKRTISRVCDLRNLLTDEHLRKLVSQLPTVPSLPHLYSELIDELSKSEPSTRTVGEVVKKDLGMTVKILQIVNSAFFGLRRRISDSREAVEMLGLDTIGSLTLGLGVISQFETRASGILFADIWAHSIAVGIMANKIAAIENRDLAGDSFTAGLLHDIGKVVLAVNLPQEFERVTQLARQEHISFGEAEIEVFQATHADVGAYLLGLWGLPSSVVQAVAYHHTPLEARTSEFSALTAVHAANAIQHSIDSSDAEDDEPIFDTRYLEQIGQLEKVPAWLEKYYALNMVAV